MVVVADSSPVNYLLLIGEIEVLAKLYFRVLVPSAVLSELRHPKAPEEVRLWASQPPDWVEVMSSKLVLSLERLDPGECEAIALATEVAADLLLIDDQAGRQEAIRRGLRVAGTLSVLDEAARAGHLDFAESMDRLRKTSFRVSLALLAQIMQRWGQS